MEKILKSEELSLTKEVDLYGQSPLHYAAHTGCANKVSKLLCKDESTVYLADSDKNTALHIAASRGYVSIMRIIILLRPDSCHMVDKKGRNILHIAVKEEKKSAVEFILQHCLMVSSLIVQKDVDGNTPLHLLATTSNCCVKKLIQHNMADKEALNKERLTPLDMVNYSNNINDWSKLRIREELRRAGATSGYPYAKKMNAMIKGMTTTIKEDDPIVKEYVPWDPTKIVDTNAMIKGMTTTIKEDDLIVKEYVPWDPRKIVDTHMLVVTLVATVAFAAGFTLPGGYTESSSTNKGMALLTKETAFKVFMIADTVALVSSIIGVVVYSSATDYISREKIKTLSRIGGGFAIIALTAMMLAFLTGTYVVLSHSPAIAVATLVVGCVSFPAYFGVLIKYLWDYLTYNM